MTTLEIGGASIDVPDAYVPSVCIVTAPPKQAAGPARRFLQAETQFNRSVVVAREAVPAGTTVEQYAQAQQQLFLRDVPGYAQTKTSTVQIAGGQCLVIEAQGKAPGGVLVNTLIAYVPVAGAIYTLSATNLAGIPFQDTRAEYMKILGSFSVATS